MQPRVTAFLILQQCDKLTVTGPSWHVVASDLTYQPSTHDYTAVSIVSSSHCNCMNSSQGRQYLPEAFQSEKMKYGLHLSLHLPWTKCFTSYYRSLQMLLPGGTCEDELTREQTKLMKNTKTVSKKVFGKLDRLL